MRTFEIALIFVNAASLFLGFKKQSQAVWSIAVTGNLILFVIHGLFEGFRYQMTFSYAFVILFSVYAFVKTNDRLFEGRVPKVLKVVAIGLSFMFLALTSFLAYALPVFTLPSPTGNYAVGIKYFHLIDENRTDPFLDKSPKKRELMIKVYYPAEQDNTKPYSPYFHNSPELIHALTTGYQIPAFLFDHLHLVKTNSKEDLQLSGKRQNYPVILFSHGAGTTVETQTSQGEDLASHGYIVVAIDHTYVSAATLFPDRIVSAQEATTDFNTAEPAEIITQIMADDAEFVMEQLGEMNEGKIDTIFKGRLDLGEIGMIGHSVGGAAAYNLAINDSRIKAAINLDGRVYITPQDPTQMAPFLMLASDTFRVTLQGRKSLMKKFEEMPEEERKITVSIYGSRDAYQEAYNKDYQNTLGLIDVLETSGNLYTIEGSDHMKFTDIGLWIGTRPLRELIGIRGDTDPATCLEIAKAVSVAFFDQHLKGEKDSWEALLQKYPKLKRVDWN